MIPGSVAALIKIPLTLIQNTAAGAISLAKALTGIQAAHPGRSVFFDFTSAWRRANPNSTRDESYDAYRAARFWQDAGSVYSAFPADMPLDARLAREIGGPGNYQGDYQRYLYNVEATLVNPLTGDQRTYNFWVRDSNILSPSDLYDAVHDDLVKVSGESPPPGGTTEFSGYNIEYHVADFARYT